MEPITLKQRISFLKSAWAWAMEKKLVNENPWMEPLRQVKVPPKQRPKPFTAEERQKIVAAFRGDRYFAYYADFVEFLLGAGCRPGEACALKWKHVTDDCGLVWIGEAYSRGELGPTKTNEQRYLRLTPRLQDLLRRENYPMQSRNNWCFLRPKGDTSMIIIFAIGPGSLSLAKWELITASPITCGISLCQPRWI
jgi:integrase